MECLCGSSHIIFCANLEYYVWRLVLLFVSQREQGPDSVDRVRQESARDAVSSTQHDLWLHGPSKQSCRRSVKLIYNIYSMFLIIQNYYLQNSQGWNLIISCWTQRSANLSWFTVIMQNYWSRPDSEHVIGQGWRLLRDMHQWSC